MLKKIIIKEYKNGNERIEYFTFQHINKTKYLGFVNSEGKMFKSIDGGKNWFLIEIEKPQSLSFDIYPNPADDNINYSYYLTEDSYVEIELFDIFGKSLFKIEERKPSGSFSIPIDLKELQTGVYFIKSKINNTQFNNKFMKK